MLLWRVSPSTDLASSCQADEAGRWAWASRPMLYTSSTPELAVLEALAHWAPGGRPHWLVRVTLPRRASVRQVQRLPADWREDKAYTRRVGNAWFDRRGSAALVVPSALCPEANNVLVNPAHPSAAGLRLQAVRPFRFDRRLLRPDDA